MLEPVPIAAACSCPSCFFTLVSSSASPSSSDVSPAERDIELPGARRPGCWRLSADADLRRERLAGDLDALGLRPAAESL